MWKMTVREARFIIHNTGAHEGPSLLSENHVTMYLCCDYGLSVQMNMRTDESTSMGSSAWSPERISKVRARSEVSEYKSRVTSRRKMLLS